LSFRDQQSFQPNQPSMPSSGQILLATLTGVAIGLALSNFYKHPTQVKTAQARPDQIASQLSLASGPSHESRPKGLLDFSDVSLWPKLEGRMNVLLMGVDSNGRDTERFTGCRSDTMMIASLDPKSHRVSLVSLPRDSRVRIADNHGVDKINAAHALGGPELAVKTVSEDFAVPIDHYIVIDAQGLKKAFEVLGPVDVLVEKPMHYRDRAGHLNIALEPGVVSMDAAKLEEYVRFRHDAKGDIGRIERQQWFMRQVKKKLEEPQVLLKLPQLFKLAGDYVRTDLSMEEMAKLAGFSKDIKPGEIQTAMLPGVGTTVYGGSYWLPDAEGAAIVLHRLLGSPLAAGTIANNTGLTIRTVASDSRAPDSADAANIDLDALATHNDNVNAALAASYNDKPLSVIVRYPRGGEELAKALEGRLAAKGLIVKYRQRGESSECAHEQIIATSYRADDDRTAKLKGSVGELEPFAVSLNLDPRASSDFIVILSPNSKIAAPEPTTEISDAQSTSGRPSALGKNAGTTLSR
jgi:polyisoprenyl-teichoic acid--peptidoglycan teichoic acid transferase